MGLNKNNAQKMEQINYRLIPNMNEWSITGLNLAWE